MLPILGMCAGYFGMEFAIDNDFLFTPIGSAGIMDRNKVNLECRAVIRSAGLLAYVITVFINDCFFGGISKILGEGIELLFFVIKCFLTDFFILNILYKMFIQLCPCET